MPSTSDQSGEWIHPDVTYVDPHRRSCDFCGRPIARNYWRETVEGDQHIYCSPNHADLYRTYWLPTHRANESPNT